jgi:hypothetical protein
MSGNKQKPEKFAGLKAGFFASPADTTGETGSTTNVEAEPKTAGESGSKMNVEAEPQGIRENLHHGGGAESFTPEEKEHARVVLESLHPKYERVDPHRMWNWAKMKLKEPLDPSRRPTMAKEQFLAYATEHGAPPTLQFWCAAETTEQQHARLMDLYSMKFPDYAIALTRRPAGAVGGTTPGNPDGLKNGLAQLYVPRK